MAVSGVRLELHLDGQDARPLYIQLAAQLRAQILAAAIQPGARLPTADEIGRAAGVNTNTVLRSLRLLRSEGIVDFRRGRSITVAQNAVADSKTPVSRLDQRVRHAISQAVETGMTRGNIIAILDDVLANSVSSAVGDRRHLPRPRDGSDYRAGEEEVKPRAGLRPETFDDPARL